MPTSQFLAWYDEVLLGLDAKSNARGRLQPLLVLRGQQPVQQQRFQAMNRIFAIRVNQFVYHGFVLFGKAALCRFGAGRARHACACTLTQRPLHSAACICAGLPTPANVALGESDGAHLAALAGETCVACNLDQRQAERQRAASGLHLTLVPTVLRCSLPSGEPPRFCVKCSSC